MKLSEIKKNIFESDEEYFAHCIASDCGMGAGVAVPFNKKFKLRNKLLDYSDTDRNPGSCILVNNVFNLITKKRSSGKPTYATLESSLISLRNQMIELGIKKIGMPKIGCGLDRLQWGVVREMLMIIFGGLDIEMNIYYI